MVHCAWPTRKDRARKKQGQAAGRPCEKDEKPSRRRWLSESEQASERASTPRRRDAQRKFPPRRLRHARPPPRPTCLALKHPPAHSLSTAPPLHLPHCHKHNAVHARPPPVARDGAPRRAALRRGAPAFVGPPRRHRRAPRGTGHRHGRQGGRLYETGRGMPDVRDAGVLEEERQRQKDGPFSLAARARLLQRPPPPAGRTLSLSRTRLRVARARTLARYWPMPNINLSHTSFLYPPLSFTHS